MVLMSVHGVKELIVQARQRCVFSPTINNYIIVYHNAIILTQNTLFFLDDIRRVCMDNDQ